MSKNSEKRNFQDVLLLAKEYQQKRALPKNLEISGMVLAFELEVQQQNLNHKEEDSEREERRGRESEQKL